MNYEECEKVIAANVSKGIFQLWLKQGSDNFLKIKANGLYDHLQNNYHTAGFNPNPYLIGWRLTKKITHQPANK